MADAATLTPFSTVEMLGVISNLRRPTNGIARAFFPTIQQSEAETIMFDVDSGKRWVAPFVHPRVKSAITTPRGQDVRAFKPAYIKQITPFEPDVAVRRQAGESFGGVLTAEQRRDTLLGTTLQDHVDAIDRRMELMAVDFLVRGKVLVKGDKYPAVDLDFKRDARLNLPANSLTGIAQWSNAASKPADKLEELSEIALELSGSATRDIVMDGTAWRDFRGNPSVRADLDIIKLDAGTLASAEPQSEGLMLRGQYQGFRIWTYAGWHYDETEGEDIKTLSGGNVFGVGTIDGIQHFGAIADWRARRQARADEELAQYINAAGLFNGPIFAKSWEEEDPSELVVQTQCAPLVVPRRPNASWAMKVRAA